MADSPPMAKGYGRPSATPDRDKRTFSSNLQSNFPNRRHPVQTHAVEVEHRQQKRDNQVATVPR